MIPGFCIAQNKKDSINNLITSKVERFDRTTFDKHKVNGEYTFTLKDGSVVRQSESEKRANYSEQIIDSIKPYVMCRVFYMHSCSLKVKGEKFYDFPIGVWQYFDENGHLTEEVNWEEPYKISIKDLYTKMKNVNVDIMDKTKRVVVTREDSPEPYYKVFSPVETGKSEMNIFVIDGINGDIVSKMTGQIKKN
jgi:hypothetical protein